MDETMVEAKGLSKAYASGSGSGVVALSGIDLKVKRGEFVSLMGPSGSGKSTLLNILGGLDQPSGGKLFIEGKEVDFGDSEALVRLHRQTVGFVFQAFNLIPTMNALENVCYPMHFNRVSRSLQKKRASELLEMVGLEDRVQHLPSELSGGEQQRVAIARALANSPKLILADEPTGNLDSGTGNRIAALMKQVNREEGISFVVTTHDPEMAGNADRVIKLRDGRVVSGATFTCAENPARAFPEGSMP